MIPIALTAWRYLKPFSGYILVAALVASALFFVHHKGYRAGVAHERAVQAKALAEAQERAAETKKKSDAITTKVRADLASANAQIATLSTKLKSEIPRYVTPEASRRCVVPRGYVLLDSAASGGRTTVPPASSELANADSGLDLTQLAETNVKNAAAFNTAIAEIEAWRGWYARQADLWEKEYGAKP